MSNLRRRNKGKKANDTTSTVKESIIQDDDECTVPRDPDEDLVDLYGEAETNWGKGRQIAVIFSLLMKTYNIC